MIRKATTVAIACFAAALPHAAAARGGAREVVPQATTGAAAPARAPLSRFAPSPDGRDHRLDWAHWDEALGWMVIPMGPSLRQGSRTVDPGTGTRRIYGHESRLRMEGNRVAFSFMTPEIFSALGDYRADLERIGSTLDIARLPRNEQLAYWLNLHNVAVIEALARAYPLSMPGERRFGPNAAPLDDALLVTVAGVALSPRDIREKIVYPHWRDPKVIYGFWRGEIGGPSIQRFAFTGGNVDALLALGGEEFVNSLRGVEAWGGALRVSRLYEEAAPFYFRDDAALRSHLAKFAGEDVAALLRKHERIATSAYEGDLADLARGERDPSTNFVCTLEPTILTLPAGAGGTVDCATQKTRIDAGVVRFMSERNVKLGRAYRKGVRTGMVIYADGQYADAEGVKEVE